MRTRFRAWLIIGFTILSALGLNCFPNIGGRIADTLDYFVGFAPGDTIVRTDP